MMLMPLFILLLFRLSWELGNVVVGIYVVDVNAVVYIIVVLG